MTSEDEPDEEALFAQALGRRIAQARESRGMKQEVAAATIHVAAATFSRWEQGHHAPGAFSLVRVAQMLGVTVEWLCGLTQQPSVELAQHPGFSPGDAVVDEDGFRQLREAAAASAPLATLNGLLNPPTIHVAWRIPRNYRVVPAEAVDALRDEIQTCFMRLR